MATCWPQGHELKIRTLYLLKLSKLEKRKCPYFIDLWPRRPDVAISSCEAQEVEYVPSSRGENANILAPGPQITKLMQLC